MNEEFFSSFLYQKSKRYYLMQKWSSDEHQTYLSLLLTDCINYWTQNCNICLWLNDLIGLIFFQIQVTKNEVEKASNFSNFELVDIKSQFQQAFGHRFSDDFEVKLDHSSDYMNTTVSRKHRFLNETCFSN
jgi:hypothetical protein